MRKRGRPEALVSDNGPEFTSRAFDQWRHQRGLVHHLIKPGRPMQNGTCESFNGRFRNECLNENWFKDLAEARQVARAWLRDYNHHRPHTALGGLPPAEFARRWAGFGRLRLPSPSPATPLQSTWIPHKYRANHGGNVIGKPKPAVGNQDISFAIGISRLSPVARRRPSTNRGIDH